MTVAIDMAAAFKRAKQLRRVKLSAHSVNNAALDQVDQQFFMEVCHVRRFTLWSSVCPTRKP
ncbi:hypothetical protein T10_2377 [Trichinella papuae]|uniref:Uncharacterized protein n=1 Tax=Trichinella papuae TaxID=268474 RepID=A0A0V1MWZ2_9BILA|nr:hypothetical protein T10_2377 [Trichinella papuae]